MAFEQVLLRDSDGRIFHIPGLSTCESFNEFERVVFRHTDPVRPKKLYWIYKDNTLRIKIDIDNFRKGLEDEQQNLCFIYVHYKFPLPAKLTQENLYRHTTGYAPPSLKLESETSSDKSSENLSTKSNVSRNSETSCLCKTFESCICRCCNYNGETLTTVGAHIFEIKEIEAVDKEFRKSYLLCKFGLDTINHVSNLICLCNVCHKYFDDQLLKLHPHSLIWEVNPKIFSERSGVHDIYYSKLNGTSCKNKIALNQNALAHRYSRTSKEVDIDKLLSDLRELSHRGVFDLSFP